MDRSTLTLLLLLAAAFCWWFKLQIDENRRLVKQLRKEEKERQARAERVRRLYNR